jgi:hypothetical protein
MRYWIGLTLFALTAPLWLTIFVACFAWKVGESMAEYILDDTLAEKYKLWKASNGG